MKRLLVTISMVLASGFALAQSSAPAAKGADAASGPEATAPVQPQRGGPGPRGRMMRFDEKNTPGWSLMTQEERLAHRDRMHSFKSVDECKAYHDEHGTQMESRAKEQGKSFRPMRGEPCTMMQQRGFIK